MPINSPSRIDTNVNVPHVAPSPGTDLLLKSLLSGQSSIQQIIENAQQNRARSDLSAQGAQQDAANTSAAQAQKSDLDTQGKEADLKRALGALSSGDAPQGASLASGSAHIGQDPTAKREDNERKNEAMARNNAQKLYNSETKSVAERLAGVKEMNDALTSNDPNSRGKVIQAYMTANGFKRFNTPEGYALAPPSIQEQIAQGAAKFGFNPKDMFSQGALTAQQRNQFAKDGMNLIESLKDADSTAKQKALGAYKGQTFASPAGLAALDTNMGGAYNSQFDNLTKGLSKHRNTAYDAQPTLAQAGGQPDQASNGLMDAAKKGLGALFGARQPAAQPQAQAQPPGVSSLLKPQTPAQGFRVKEKATGRTGTLDDPSEFDPAKYDKI